MSIKLIKLEEALKEFVAGELNEIGEESEWFAGMIREQVERQKKDIILQIVDERLNEIQDSESEDKYFLVRWGEGYSTNRPAVYEMKEFLDDDFWNLPSDFIDSLIKAMPCEKLKFTDLSGDVYFHCLGDGKDNRGGLAAGIGYGRS